MIRFSFIVTINILKFWSFFNYRKQSWTVPRLKYSWVELSFFSGIPHVARITEPRLARFLYWSVECINKFRAFFLARCHHGLCSDIIYRPLQNIKLDWNLFPTGIFFIFQFSDDVKDAHVKKCQRNPSGRQLSTIPIEQAHIENVLRATKKE